MSRFPRVLSLQLSSLKTMLALAIGATLLLPGGELNAGTGCGIEPSQALISTLTRQAVNLNPGVLRLALSAKSCAGQRGLVRRERILTVIDYSLPSTEPRLFVFDLERQRLLFRELVAHGKNSGSTRTTRFSNEEGSLATSIGLYVTDFTYNGSNGYSLKLRGLDEGFNDRAWERAIVMHGARYVSESVARSGRLGRSWGCPAVRTEIARELIDTVKGGTAVFSYFPDNEWLGSSAFLRGARSNTPQLAEAGG